MVPSVDLKNYVLKQFVHNDSGQYLVGEREENLYLLVPGTNSATRKLVSSSARNKFRNWNFILQFYRI